MAGCFQSVEGRRHLGMRRQSAHGREDGGPVGVVERRLAPLGDHVQRGRRDHAKVAIHAQGIAHERRLQDLGGRVERQVQDIWIIDNDFDLGPIDVPAVMISRRDNFPPTRVSLIRNRFEFPTCAPIAIDCPAGQCWENNNEKTATANQGC